MNIVGSAIALSVVDLAASCRFFTTHLGFRELVASEDFACLERDDGAVEVVLLQRDPELPPSASPGPTGVLMSFAVTDIVTEQNRLLRAHAPITVPLRREPGGQWILQLTDPNGVEVQLTEWSPPAGTTH
ncbi:VOC family protein [Nocardia sp. NPDC057440]|uniref:VOC family protein n=1 Tax=Nocardia sp. NPDC057440 TaxID=3346134 RepID=UPI00366B4732